jgi:beta-N-acetylhexosaminidase
MTMDRGPVAGVTRRRFLRGVLALGAWAVAAAVAACGGAVASISPAPTGGRASGPPTLPPSTGEPPTSGPVDTPPPLTLRQKIGRMLIVGFRGTALDDGDPILEAIKKGELGGVILFDRDLLTKSAGRNIVSPEQVAALTDGLHSSYPDLESGRFIVAIDQEGGKVARLNPSNGFPATESEASLGSANDLGHTADVANVTASSLVDAGVDLNLAPVVDLNVNPKNPAIGALGRSFSANADVVVAQATAVIDAHHGAGLLCCIKHFPGEGSATGNTDTGVVDVTGTWTEAELKPFSTLASEGVPDAVMVGNISDRTTDGGAPMTLSKATVSGILRDRLGWDGVVVTDDLQAGAIRAKYQHAEAVALAIEAGVDILLFANQQVYEPDVVAKTIDAIVGFVQSGRISEDRIDESVSRIAGMLAPID